MYNVALCEDEKVFAAELEKICHDIFDKLNIEYHIDIFETCEEFFAAFTERQQQYDLILLDIVMDGLDGIELARKIRETDKDTVIIFITAYHDYALKGYDVNALHYLMKPVDIAVLERLIKTAYAEKYQDKVIIIKMGEQRLRVPINDIVCLETAKRRVEVTMIDKTIYYSGKLKDLLSDLPSDRFVRCHQAYAVNVKNIQMLNRKSAVTADGKEIPISRTFAKDTQKAFLRCI